MWHRLQSVLRSMHNNLPTPAFDHPKHHLRIYQGDCLNILAQIPASSVDLVFADPPYFLSNGGITCHAGKMVSVNKGSWDVSGPRRQSRLQQVLASRLPARPK